jgi:hypothetical protein
MSISGVSSNSPFDSSAPSSFQKIEQELQQLGQDLQTGNLAAAQQDFVTLQQDFTHGGPQPASQSSNPIAQAFDHLALDLQAGNLTAAQQDFATIQQDIQAVGQRVAQGGQGAEGHHAHHAEGGSNGSSEISQLLSQLGQELKSGSLSAAQQTYASLQQDFEQVSAGVVAQSQVLASSTAGAISVSA